MLTNQVDVDTFIIQDKTYSSGTVIELTEKERIAIADYADLAEKLESQRIEMFDTLHYLTSNADQALAREFYAYDAKRYHGQYRITSLVREVCTRLGGLLPLAVVKSAEGVPELVVQSLANSKGSVVLTVDSIRQATGFSQLVGDIRNFGALLLDKTLAKGISMIGHIDPKSWNQFGCPYIVIQNTSLTTAYAADKTDFKWADHEGQSLDQRISEALASLLSSPGRFALMKNGTQPMSFIAGVVEESKITLLNLTATTYPGDEFRLALLRSRVNSDSTALFLLQFGPLRKEGSTHDFSEDMASNQNQMGISLTLVIKTDSGPIIGTKSWSFVQEASGEPALKVYGLFENSAGLSANTATDLLKNILVEPVSV